MRARIYEDERGFMVKWQANRRYQTREEAEQAAQLPLPPPVRKARATTVTPKLRAMLRQFQDSGISAADVAEILNVTGIPTPRTADTWTAAMVRAATNYEPPTRDAPAMMVVLRLEEPVELWSTVEEDDLGRLRQWLRSEPRRERLLDDALDLLQPEDGA
jgi:hypothetical protein